MPDFLNLPDGEATARAIVESAPMRPAQAAKSNYASRLGDICERRLVLARTKGDEAIPPSPALAGIFETGNLITPIFLDRVLNPFGRKQTPSWEIREQERIPSDALFTKLNIGLRIDGVRHVADTTGRMRPFAVVEFKTTNSNLFARIKTLDDIGLTYWMAKAPDQLLLGMTACELVDHAGWLILINKGNLYECRIIEVPYDYGRVERLLARAERINGHIADGTLPNQINRPGVCENCDFLTICAPRLVGDPSEAPRIIAQADNEYEAIHSLLADHVLLEETAKEATGIKTKLKKQLIPGQNLVVGQFVVTWKVHGKGWRMDVVDTGDGFQGKTR